MSGINVVAFLNDRTITFHDGYRDINDGDPGYLDAVRAIYDACATILGTGTDAKPDDTELWRLRAAVIDAYFTDHPDVSIAAVDALRDALGNWDGAR